MLGIIEINWNTFPRSKIQFLVVSKSYGGCIGAQQE